ncbi:MAG: hypothetical protein WDZ96_05160 [Acidimicrobiia bacterium]
MELEENLLKRVRSWDKLSRWEKSELGRDLRTVGMSYGEIMDLIPVKKSTLATWCRDVRLTTEQIEGIKARTDSVKGIPRDTQRKRREEVEQIRARARGEVPWLALDANWVAGAVLYWAEGAKSRNDLSMANTDPRALRLFISWIRAYVKPDAEFRLALHLHEGNDDDTSQDHWRGELNLPDVRFHKTFIKPRGTGHRKNTHIHGVCTVRVLECSDAWQVITAWIDELPRHLELDEAQR